MGTKGRPSAEGGRNFNASCHHGIRGRGFITRIPPRPMACSNRASYSVSSQLRDNSKDIKATGTWKNYALPSRILSQNSFELSPFPFFPHFLSVSFFPFLSSPLLLSSVSYFLGSSISLGYLHQCVTHFSFHSFICFPLLSQFLKCNLNVARILLANFC